jgi:poly-beta-1,6-N-acetyl-D-glucosamine synthase
VKRFYRTEQNYLPVLAVLLIAGLAVLIHELGFAVEFNIEQSEELLNDLSFGGYLMLTLLVFTSLRFAILMMLGTFNVVAQQRGKAKLDRQSLPSTSLPSVSIIMPVFNEGITIAQSLDSLFDIDYPDLEILVIDDGSKDQTYLHAHRMQARAIASGKRLRLLTQANTGKAQALNLGIAECGGEVVVCIDGDGVIAPDALKRAMLHFGDPSVGALAGSVRVANRDTLLTKLQALEYLTGLGLPKSAQNLAGAVLIVPGPLGVFRKKAIVAVGGYEPDTYAEDFDLTLKLLGAGWRVHYDPEVQGATECPGKLADLVKQRYRWSRGILQVIAKRRAYLLRPGSRPMQSFGAWLLVLESILLPLLNVGGHLAFVAASLSSESSPLTLLWWLQLVLLDCAVAIYCLTTEGEQTSLIWVAPLQRVFYTLFIDCLSLFAAWDEWRGSSMTWGNLARAGKLSGKA